MLTCGLIGLMSKSFMQEVRLNAMIAAAIEVNGFNLKDIMIMFFLLG